ncbi:MAG: hypothetical protein AAGC44_04625 [Planctomycetota bacterium]
MEKERLPAPQALSDVEVTGRCLVLTPVDTTVSGALLAALSRRGLSVHLVQDEPSIMVELAGAGCAVVVAVEPARWFHLAELAYAIRQHYPAVYCWQFTLDDAGRPHIGGLELEYLGPQPPQRGEATLRGAALANEQATLQSVSDRADSGVHSAGGEAIGPIGRIHGRRRVMTDLAIQAPNAPAPSGALISEEELTMLLGPTPGEAG